MLQSHFRRSSGFSLGGFILVLGVISFFALIAMKLVPTYIEFHSVKSSFNELSTQSFKSETALLRSIDEKFSVNYVSSVKGRDVQISRSNGAYELSVDYDVVKPFIGNVSLDIHFSYDVTTQPSHGGE